MKIIKLTPVILIILSIYSCNLKNTNQDNILDYYNCDTNTIYKNFEYITDTEITTIILKQDATKLNDTTWEFGFYLLRPDSLPINKLVEHYYTNNSIKLIEQSYYELDSLNQPIEVKAVFNDENSSLLNNKNSSFDFEYIFQTDSDLFMKIHVDVLYEFKRTDTLGVDKSKYLIISTEEKISLEYSDQRQDTTVYSKSLRVFAKEKGLILFGQSADVEQTIYRLKE